MEPRECRVHGVVNRRALGGLGIRHVRLPDDAALDVVHEIEGRAGDARVVAVEQRRGDRKFLRMERADHAELAVDRVRGRKQLTGRLAAQHITAGGRLEKISGIGLPALELAHAQWRREVRQSCREIGFEPRGLERERAGNVFGAGERGLAIDRRHGRERSSDRAKRHPGSKRYAPQTQRTAGARGATRRPMLAKITSYAPSRISLRSTRAGRSSTLRAAGWRPHGTKKCSVPTNAWIWRQPWCRSQ